MSAPRLPDLACSFDGISGPVCDPGRVVDVTDALLGAGAGAAVGSLWKHC
jgi:hypothetical protein